MKPTPQPTPSPQPEPDLLRRGKAFGKLVARYYQYQYEHQSQFEAERYLIKKGGKSGRTDLLLWADLEEKYLVIVEVKNTDWDILHRKGTVRSNLLRHIRQVWLYLEGELPLEDSDPAGLSAPATGNEDEQPGNAGTDARTRGAKAKPGPFPIEQLDRTAAIIYPRVPTTPGLRASIEEEAAGWGISIIWFDVPPPEESDAWVAWQAMQEGKL